MAEKQFMFCLKMLWFCRDQIQIHAFGPARIDHLEGFRDQLKAVPLPSNERLEFKIIDPKKLDPATRARLEPLPFSVFEFIRQWRELDVVIH